jgi:hypothetical protein
MPAESRVELLRNATAVFAVLAFAVYFSGGFVLGLELTVRGISASAVVAELPREFLIALGLSIVLPGVVAGVAVLLAKLTLQGQLTKRGLQREAARGLAVAVAVAVAVAISAYDVLRGPPDAKVCASHASYSTTGWFIGESGSRVYIGEHTAPARGPWIISIPVSEVAQVVVGPRAVDRPCPALTAATAQ